MRFNLFIELFSILVIISIILDSTTGFAQQTNANTANYTEASNIPERPPADDWIPEDVNHTLPAVTADAHCSLADVLERAGRRVEELVKNVDRFTATEILSHQSVNGSGKMRRPTTRKFEYLVSISTARDGYFQVQEFRNRSRALDLFPGHIATVGTSSLILIFHPRYVGDFATQCEGLGEWGGQPAWQVRFEQRTDRPNHTSVFIVDGRLYDGHLRGRAWILADSYQVARLETDEEQTIPQIRLRRSHESIEYRPVNFQAHNLQLWLPSTAELYMDFKGQRFYRKHAFTDFKLFSVDTGYQVLGGLVSAQLPHAQ